MKRKVKTASAIIKDQGLLSLVIVVLQRVNTRSQKRSTKKKQKINSLVKYQDVIRADWSRLPKHIVSPTKVVKDSYKVAWIMSTPGETSGGHQNIFRFMKYLQDSGSINKVYLYDNLPAKTDLAKIKLMLSESPSYPKIDIEITHYDGKKGVDADTDAIFATGWETAYPSFNDSSKARRMYFVQDYEPYFSPVGTEHVLAENTYKFGFYGITAGGWLANKLKQDYGMSTRHFDFGAEKSTYHYTNKGQRKEVFFYARPVTTRRGFELGVMALDIFAQARPEYTITLAGWDVSNYELPFKYKNLSNLSIDKLNEVYNRCAAGLVISLTNMSLLPLELLASGVIPVVNDGPNNRMVSNNPYIEYSDPSPNELAMKLIKIVDRKDLSDYSKKASESVLGADWDKSGKRFVETFKEVMRG